MTDQEITEIIATKVMGYKYERKSEPWECWDEPPAVRDVWVIETDDCGDEVIDTFSPLTSDADCMMAWDRFSVKRGTTINRNCGAWKCVVDGRIMASNTDRRRAMCECMVKAVTND